jgi:hypothetical protein
MGSRSFVALVLGACFIAGATSLANAQMMAPGQGSPRISHIGPMGGQTGQTFEIRVAGSDLADVQGLHFNFPGVKVEAVGTGTEKNIDKKGKPLPALTVHRFNVTLPANAPFGIQEVRIITKAGISNARAFVVGDQKEFVEEEPNDDVPKAQKVEINSVVNGGINGPTDVDYYAFSGKKGQRVLVSCLTTSIDSRLPAELQLYSSSGAYLGGNRGYANNDALLDAVLPDDGEYFVRVHSFSYTLGGVEYYYRLQITTAPWIDAIFPPIVEPGKDTQVTVYGRNLPGGKPATEAVVQGRTLETATITVKAPADPLNQQRLAFSGFAQPYSSMLDGFDQRIKSPVGQSNPFMMNYARAPVVLDSGNNDDLASAQKIAVPCVIAGRLEKKADKDWYAFSAKKGQILNFEAFAERLGAPLDLYFQVRDEKGSLITEQEDTTESMSPQFFTATADPSRYRFVVPADGRYHLVVSSKEAYTQFGPRHLYTVNITSDDPDFRLVAMPLSQLNPEGTIVNQAGGAAFNVYVWRLGGFNEEITLSGEDLAPGLGLKPQVIAPGVKQANVVIHADSGANPWAGAIRIVGTATVNGKKLTREVRSATITWPVQLPNTPSITRMDRELVLAIRDKAAYSLVLGAEKLTIPQGEKISIPVKLVAGEFKGNVTVVALGGPPGLNALPVTLTPGMAGGTAVLDPKGGTPIAPGNYTIFLRGSTQPINPKQPPPKGAPANYIQISMPVSVTIVPKQLGKVTVAPMNAKLAQGKEVEITVRVARQFELPIPFKVEAVFPPGVKGVTAQPVTIKAGEDEAKLLITAAPDAAITPNTSVTIRFTAMFNDTIPVVHEAKLVLSIGK